MLPTTILGARSRLSAPDLVACTSATTDEIMSAADSDGSPEWNPGMGRFDLVTLTFGGDDIDFVPVLYQCLGLSRLLATAENVSADLGTGADSVAPLPSDLGHDCPSASIVEARITALASSYRSWLAKQLFDRPWSLVGTSWCSATPTWSSCPSSGGLGKTCRGSCSYGSMSLLGGDQVASRRLTIRFRFSRDDSLGKLFGIGECLRRRTSTYHGTRGFYAAVVARPLPPRQSVT
jgi:hypothetical protein